MSHSTSAGAIGGKRAHHIAALWRRGSNSGLVGGATSFDDCDETLDKSEAHTADADEVAATGEGASTDVRTQAGPEEPLYPPAAPAVPRTGCMLPIRRSKSDLNADGNGSIVSPSPAPRLRVRSPLRPRENDARAERLAENNRASAPTRSCPGSVASPQADDCHTGPNPASRPLGKRGAYPVTGVGTTMNGDAETAARASDDAGRQTRAASTAPSQCIRSTESFEDTSGGQGTGASTCLRPSPLLIRAASAVAAPVAGVAGPPRAAQQAVSPSSVDSAIGTGAGFSIEETLPGSGAHGTVGTALPPLLRRKSWDVLVHGPVGGVSSNSNSSSSNSTKKLSPGAGFGGRAIARGVGIGKRFGPPSSTSSNTASNSSPCGARSAASTPDLRLPPELPPSLGKRCPPAPAGPSGRTVIMTPSRHSFRIPAFPRPSGGSNSSSAASTPANRMANGVGKRQRRHRLSRSDSTGEVFNRRRTTKAFLSAWPARSFSSSSSPKNATPVGGGNRRSTNDYCGGSGIRGSGMGFPTPKGVLFSGLHGGRGSGRDDVLGADDDSSSRLGSWAKRALDSSAGSSRSSSSRVRSFSDSAFAFGDAPRAAGSEPARVMKRVQGSDSPFHQPDHLPVKQATKFRGPKLLPGSMAWPTPFSIHRKSRPPPPDDAMMSPPPSCALYGETMADGFTTRASVFEKRTLGAPTASSGRDISHAWASPFFRPRRRSGRQHGGGGSSGGGEGGGGGGGGSGTLTTPAQLAPPSPAGLRDGAETPSSQSGVLPPPPPPPPPPPSSDAFTMVGTGLMKLPPLLSLHEAKEQQQRIHSNGRGDCPAQVLSSGDGTAVSSPASATGTDEKERESVLLEGGGPSQLDGPTTGSISSTDSCDAGGGEACDEQSLPTELLADLGGSGISGGGGGGGGGGHLLHLLPMLPLPLLTPSQAKRVKTEPPRPPGRPPHAHRRQARLRRTASRVEPTDVSADEDEVSEGENDRTADEKRKVVGRKDCGSVGGASSDGPACPKKIHFGEEAAALSSSGQRLSSDEVPRVGAAPPAVRSAEGSSRVKYAPAPLLLTACDDRYVEGDVAAENRASVLIAPDIPAAASFAGGNGEHDVNSAVSEIGRAAVEQLLSSRSNSRIGVVGGGPTPTCYPSRGGFFPPSTSHGVRAAEAGSTEAIGGFSTARGSKSFFSAAARRDASAPGYDNIRVEEGGGRGSEGQTQRRSAQQLTEAAAAAPGTEPPSNSAPPVADLLDTAGGTTLPAPLDTSTGPQTEMANDCPSATDSATAADMLAEAVMEEFTIMAEEENGEGSESLSGELEGRDGPKRELGGGSGTGNRQKTIWEAYVFRKGVFQIADRGKPAGRTWAGAGDPVPPPAGICLVDQAKELHARRLYELSMCKAVPARIAADVSTRSVMNPGDGDKVSAVGAVGDEKAAGDMQAGGLENKTGGSMEKGAAADPVASELVADKGDLSKVPLPRQTGFSDIDNSAAEAKTRFSFVQRGSSPSHNASKVAFSPVLPSPEKIPAVQRACTPDERTDGSLRADTKGDTDTVGGARRRREVAEEGAQLGRDEEPWRCTSRRTSRDSSPQRALSLRASSASDLGSESAAADGTEATRSIGSARKQQPSAHRSADPAGVCASAAAAKRTGVRTVPPPLPPRSDKLLSSTSAFDGDTTSVQSSSIVAPLVDPSVVAPPVLPPRDDCAPDRRRTGSGKESVGDTASERHLTVASDFIAVGAGASVLPQSLYVGKRARAVSGRSDRRQISCNTDPSRGDARTTSTPPPPPPLPLPPAPRSLASSASSRTNSVAAGVAAATVAKAARLAVSTAAARSIRRQRASGAGHAATRARGTPDDPCDVIAAEAVHPPARTRTSVKVPPTAGHNSYPATHSEATVNAAGGGTGIEGSSAHAPVADLGQRSSGPSSSPVAEMSSGPVVPISRLGVAGEHARPATLLAKTIADRARAKDSRREEHLRREGVDAAVACTATARAGKPTPSTGGETRAKQQGASSQPAQQAHPQQRRLQADEEAGSSSSSSSGSISEGTESFHSAFSRQSSLTTAGMAASADQGNGHLAGLRIAYRPRGVSYGEKPWRAPSSQKGAINAAWAGEVPQAFTSHWEAGGSSPGNGYEPGSGQGLVVSRGVTVKADVGVPLGTVAVTRAGELRGRVVAREFLLEEGGLLEGEVECDFAVIEGQLLGSLVSREVATMGPSAFVDGDVIYNVLELDRGAVITGRLFSIGSTASNVFVGNDGRSADASTSHQQQRHRQDAEQTLMTCASQGTSADGQGQQGSHPASVSSSSSGPISSALKSEASAALATRSLALADSRGIFSDDDGEDDADRDDEDSACGAEGAAIEPIGEDSGSGVLGKGTLRAWSGLWGTVLDGVGVAWARALSDPVSTDAAGVQEATQATGATPPSRLVQRSVSEGYQDSQGDGARPRPADIPEKDAKIKQVWIRAAERRARIS